jgi:heat shock protein HslJ
MMLAPADDLARNAWRMKGVDAPVPVMEFGAAGMPRVSGFAGCNRFSGTFELTEGGRLKFGAMAVTRMACDDEAMKREQEFLEMLGKVNGYRFDGGELLLLENGWEAGRFVPAEKARN